MKRVEASPGEGTAAGRWSKERRHSGESWGPAGMGQWSSWREGLGLREHLRSNQV